MMSLNGSSSLPPWKTKIICSLLTLVVEESAQQVVKWLMPFCMMYLKGKVERQQWPRQKQPERLLFLNSVRQAMEKSGVPQQEIGEYVLGLLQDPSIFMPDQSSQAP